MGAIPKTVAIDASWRRPEDMDSFQCQIKDGETRELLEKYKDGTDKPLTPPEFDIVSKMVNTVANCIVNQVNTLHDNCKANFHIDAICSSGSGAEGTMVDKADEFDVMAKLQFNPNVTITVDMSRPGFVRLYCDQELRYKTANHGEKPITEPTDRPGQHSNVICPELTTQWMASTMKRAINNVNEKEEENQFHLREYRNKGPAYCIEVDIKDKDISTKTVHLDFVPAFRLEGFNDRLFAVSKSPDSKDPELKNHWRMSFSCLEKNYFRHGSKNGPKEMQRTMELVYRLLKLENLPVNSYVKKNVLFDYAANSDKKMWTLDRTAEIFKDCRDKIKECMVKRELNHFFLDPSNSDVRDGFCLSTVPTGSINLLAPH